ncbi:MAG TPA: hypothetical protein VKI44_29700, partial [Acetobacteraceae bacterium]|nr:hypothetical protein [Acetobacteraceae bacterium]
PQEIERQLDHNIQAEIQATEDGALVKGLVRSLRATTPTRPVSWLAAKWRTPTETTVSPNTSSGQQARVKADPGNRAESGIRGDVAGVNTAEQLPECHSSLPGLLCKHSDENSPELREAQISCDRPHRPISSNPAVPLETPPPKPGRARKERKSADVVLFPGGRPTAAPKPEIMLLPARSKAERAKLKIDVGALGGELLAQQIDQLDRHEQLLEDYGHLIKLCVAPHDCLDLNGLSETARQEKIAAVQKAALSLLLPTGRDTLAGAIRILTCSLATTVQLTCRVADLARASIRDDEGDDSARRKVIEGLDVPALRKVQEAIAIMSGQRASAAEPPMPPPPEAIDDLARWPANNQCVDGA